MAEYSRLAKGSFTSTGASKAIYLPFQPDSVEMWNYSASATPALNGVTYAYWDVSMGQGFAIENVYLTNNATPAYFLGTDVVVANGISTFAAGLALQYGPTQTITGMTAANPPVVTLNGHGYSTGDVVIFQGLFATATTGLPQLTTIPFTVTRINANSFSVAWDASTSPPYTGVTTGTVKKVLYPFLYAPGVSYISAITRGTTTTVTTTTAHNLSVGSEVAFRIPNAWGTVELNQLPNSLIPGSPKYGYVVSVTNAFTFVCSINSTGFTAFNVNQPASPTAGLQYPQVIAVGDVNTGGTQISAGSQLYPSPSVNGVSTINGPAIQGAFVNNTRQGFLIGNGVGATVAASSLVGANGNVIYWKASVQDYTSP